MGGRLGLEIGDARNSSQIWNLDDGDSIALVSVSIGLHKGGLLGVEGFGVLRLEMSLCRIIRPVHDAV